MKNVFKILMAILFAGFIFTSCEKSSNEPELLGDQGIENAINPVLTPEFRLALTEAVTDYTSQYPSERGATPPPAFFMDNVFGFFDNDLINLAVFSTVTDDDDYLIVNDDGTVDVKINSHDAICEMTDYSTFASYYGENGHAFMKYSGPAEILPFFYNGIFFFVYFVAPDNNTPASVWHGNGKVELVGGSGGEKNLVAHMVANKGWKKVKSNIKIK